jgi:beta-phosphoglucomutase-like phosphatase (HAD superfamily)
VLIKRHHFHFTEERFYSLGGVPSHDILQRIKEEQGLTFDPLSVAKEKEAEYLNRLSLVKPIEPIVQIAKDHFGSIPLAVASGGTRLAIETVLNHLGIRALFSAVITNEDVVRQKPAPDIFLEAAKRLATKPVYCRAFEDTELGLTAIRQAGMEPIDVRKYYQKPSSENKSDHQNRLAA